MKHPHVGQAGDGLGRQFGHHRIDVDGDDGRARAAMSEVKAPCRARPPE